MGGWGGGGGGWGGGGGGGGGLVLSPGKERFIVCVCLSSSDLSFCELSLANVDPAAFKASNQLAEMRAL